MSRAPHRHATWESEAAEMGLPKSWAQPTLVAYRSVGIGVFGAVMRYVGMPLEKMALYMNSSQVSGHGQLRQAAKLTFADGVLAPYRVVGPASMTAWFLQYSVMGVAFQFFDQGLSQAFNVEPVAYGKQLMEPAHVGRDGGDDHVKDASYQLRSAAARILSPILAASMESFVSNRAECQRFFGPTQFHGLEQQLGANALARAAGPAFAANALRNIVMVNTSFLITPMTYKYYFPQERKSQTTLFWYGLSVNIFVGNVVAITQQALWGRSLDYFKQHGRIDYRQVIGHGLRTEGVSAFFTAPKWFSRVLMNAPAQGTLPWFYNEVLPLGENMVLQLVKNVLYHPELTGTPSSVTLSRRMSNFEQLADAIELEPLPSGFTPHHEERVIHPHHFDDERPTAFPQRAARPTAIHANSPRA